MSILIQVACGENNKTLSFIFSELSTKLKLVEELSKVFIFLRGVSLARPAPTELPQVWKEARAGG